MNIDGFYLFLASKLMSELLQKYKLDPQTKWLDLGLRKHAISMVNRVNINEIFLIYVLRYG